MDIHNLHGVITHGVLERKTDYLFRLSIKALIQNDNGEVLVVKEADRQWWDIPGGGMDHRESIKEALARELKEEISLSGDFTYEVISVDETDFLTHINLWQVRLIFLVKPTVTQFKPGEDCTELTFIDPGSLKGSAHSVEQRIYYYSQLV